MGRGKGIPLSLSGCPQFSLLPASHPGDKAEAAAYDEGAGGKFGNRCGTDRETHRSGIVGPCCAAIHGQFV